MLSGGACSTFPGPAEVGPSACWLGQSGRVVGPADPLIGVGSEGCSSTPQRGQLLPSPGWARVPGRCQVAGMGQLPRNVPVGRFRNGALRSLYPHARGFGTWRKRWGFHFREFPILAVGGPRTAHLSRYPMLWGGGDTALCSPNARCVRRETMPNAWGAPRPMWETERDGQQSDIQRNEFP